MKLFLFFFRFKLSFLSNYLLFLYFFIFHKVEIQSQNLFFQDIFYGGVIAGGFSTGIGIGEGMINLNFDSNSEVKKAYIFSYSSSNADDSVKINDNFFRFNYTNCISVFNHSVSNYNPIKLHAIDITNWLIETPTNQFYINIPFQEGLPFKGVFAPFIWIAYENVNLPLINAVVIVNNQDLIGSENYEITNINPINTNNPVGFSIFSDRSNDYLNKVVAFNGNLLGILGGSDQINSQWPFSGVKGHFYYQNNELFGLDDDTPDNIMGGSDGLADVSSLISNNATNCNFTLSHINFPNQPTNETNVNLAYFLTYTTPCISFDVTVSQDTTICPNIPLQLSATGGTRYEWQPATGLSCTDCPNPIATLDSSQLYTVRIWNNDSCSVVRPVKVNVRDLPRFQSINPTATVCGLAIGNVVAVAQNSTALPVSYSLNGAAFQPSSTFTEQFSNIEAGEYTLSLQDGFGCQRDTVFSIGSNNTTQAQFTASPQSGAAPLTVSFTNTSVNATDVEWFINGVSQGVSFSSFTFDTSGVYTVTLVAWQNSSVCADTFSLQISVFDTLLLQIPNVFTPNNDGVNDFYSITSNIAVNYECLILNRWGNVVASKKSTFTPGVPELIWDGKDATDGTYFYTLEVEWENETKKVEGFVVKIGK